MLLVLVLDKHNCLLYSIFCECFGETLHIISGGIPQKRSTAVSVQSPPHLIEVVVHTTYLPLDQLQVVKDLIEVLVGRGQLDPGVERANLLLSMFKIIDKALQDVATSGGSILPTHNLEL